MSLYREGFRHTLYECQVELEGGYFTSFGIVIYQNKKECMVAIAKDMLRAQGDDVDSFLRIKESRIRKLELPPEH